MVGAPTDDAKARGEMGGRRSWAYRYRAEAARREMGLGKFPDVSIDAARKMAAEFKVETITGHDPKAERDRRRKEAEAESRAQANKVTFKEAAEAYVAAGAPNWKGRHAVAEWIPPIRDYAFPIVGDLACDEIERSHVRDAIAKKPSTIIKLRLRARIEAILNYTGEQEWRDEGVANPAAPQFHKSRRPQEGARDRAPSATGDRRLRRSSESSEAPLSAQRPSQPGS